MPGEDAEGQARRAPWARLWVPHFLGPEGDHSKAAPAWPHSPLPPWLLSALPGMGPCRGPGFKGERSFLEQRRAEAEAAGGEPLGGGLGWCSGDVVDPADGSVALGEAWSWGPLGSGLFICTWQ